jgi:hypothetical protein
MDRREFVRAGIATTALGVRGLRTLESEPPAPRRYYELRTYELRSDIDPARLRAFLKDGFLPALARVGAGTVGLFSPDTGFPSPSVLALIEYPSLASIETAAQQLEADPAFAEARRAFEVGDQLPFVRYDARLMRAFSQHPRIEVPPGDAARAPRMFELRTYEARSADALAHKIAMFNDAEITLFRSIGMTPVFFGENMFGTRLPSLTYMLTFDDIAARTKAWATFRAHPEWQRLSKDPRYDVRGAVSNTNVAYLSPLPFSTIR